MLKELLSLLSELLFRGMELVTESLASLGVPEVYWEVGALGVLYLLATLVALLFILLLLRLVRRRKAPKKRAEEVAQPTPAEPAGPLPEEVPPAGVEPGPVEAEPLREAPPEEAPPAPGPVEAVEEEAPAPAPLPAEEELPAAPAEPAVEAAPPVSEEAPEVAPPLSLFDRMRAGLSKTRTSLVKRIDALLSAGGGVDDEMLEELEEILITADFGMKTTQDLVQALEKGLARSDGSDPGALRDLLKEEIRKRLRLEAEDLDTASASPFVVMVVGVNGVGKTTTIGKLAYQFAGQGKKVVLGAGDTFRAAAADQLGIWAERAGVELVRHAEGADPAAVAFDAAKAATARGADVLILDTAGRLHTKVNLMEEMKKIHRVLGREIPGAPHEVLLVLDSTTGQNALVQARNFKETVKVSGVALTKLDGTAKGGMVVAIGNELDLPVRFVGIGEGIEDLRPFDPDMFVDALFEKD